MTARTVLAGILRRPGAELSAHQMLEAEHDQWNSVAQVAAEYETIAATAQRDRWVELVRGSGLAPSQVAQDATSDAFGPLAAMLRRAEATGHDVEGLISSAVARRGLADADDVAAILQHRLQLAAAGMGKGVVHLIAGVIPEGLGPMTLRMRKALDDRRELIESRATALVADALRLQHPWVKRMGLPPDDPVIRARWSANVRTVAAYRDRYQIDSALPLGASTRSSAQQADVARAQAAYRRAVATSGGATAGRGQGGGRDAIPRLRRVAFSGLPALPRR